MSTPIDQTRGVYGKYRIERLRNEDDGPLVALATERAVAWPVRGRYLVEIDGGAYIGGRHTRGKGFANDAEKASAAAILGYRVIRCVPEQVEDGRCLSWIKAALGIGEAAA